MIDDYVCVSSRSELKHILNAIETYSSYVKPRFSLLEVEYVDGNTKVHEKIYDEKELLLLKDIL